MRRPAIDHPLRQSHSQATETVSDDVHAAVAPLHQGRFLPHHHLSTMLGLGHESEGILQLLLVEHMQMQRLENTLFQVAQMLANIDWMSSGLCSVTFNKSNMVY